MKRQRVEKDVFHVSTLPLLFSRTHLMTQTYLITGGAGFLGINLARYLLARGHRVISYDIAEFNYPERSQITEV